MRLKNSDNLCLGETKCQKAASGIQGDLGEQAKCEHCPQHRHPRLL